MAGADGWTISEAVHQLHPPIKRRDLARLMAGTPPVGRRYGRLGRRPEVFSIEDLLRVHAKWVRSRDD